MLAGAESKPRADEAPSRAILKPWIGAARTAADKPLVDLTALPFEYRTTNKKKLCEGNFQDSKAFEAWHRCFRKAQNLLLEDFGNGGTIEDFAPPDRIPRALAALSKRVKISGAWRRG